MGKRKALVRLHLWHLRETMRLVRIHSVFVDLGSDPKIETPEVGGRDARYHFEPAYSWNESLAKNIGLSMVETPLVAFTNADTWITFRTIQRTLDIIDADAGEKPFILNGYRWEVPRLLTDRAIQGQTLDLNTIEGLSVPHAYPKLPIGEWQVCKTETARAISGFDERMTGANSYGGMDVDFHERARAWVLREGGVEILSRKIPVLHPHHWAERPASPNTEIGRDNLLRFIQSGETETLRWDFQTRTPAGAENDEAASAFGS